MDHQPRVIPPGLIAVVQLVGLDGAAEPLRDDPHALGVHPNQGHGRGLRRSADLEREAIACKEQIDGTLATVLLPGAGLVGLIDEVEQRVVNDFLGVWVPLGVPGVELDRKARHVRSTPNRGCVQEWESSERSHRAHRRIARRPTVLARGIGTMIGPVYLGGHRVDGLRYDTFQPPINRVRHEPTLSRRGVTAFGSLEPETDIAQCVHRVIVAFERYIRPVRLAAGDVPDVALHLVDQVPATVVNQ